MSDGCWIAFDYDAGAYLQAAFVTEIEALRFTNAQGYGKVMFLRWGESLNDADVRRRKELKDGR